MGELAAASKVHVMVSYWWSRGDDLANHQLGQILTRAAGVDEVDLTDPQSLDRALRIAVADPAVLAELDAWWQIVETRRAGNGTRNPGLGLDQSIRYLTDRLDADTVTPAALGECRRQVAAVDQTIISAKNLPKPRTRTPRCPTSSPATWRHVPEFSPSHDPTRVSRRQARATGLDGEPPRTPSRPSPTSDTPRDLPGRARVLPGGRGAGAVTAGTDREVAKKVHCHGVEDASQPRPLHLAVKDALG